MTSLMPRSARLLIPLLAAALAFVSWSASPPYFTNAAPNPRSAPPAAARTAAPRVQPSPEPLPEVSADDPVLIGAGDICETKTSWAAEATAQLIKARPLAQVFTLGDNSNDKGTAAQYTGCYAKTWGSFLGRTRATVGNHDCMTARCNPYFAYFGAAAGPKGLGYYSYDLRNDWHVIVLNSDPEQLGRGFNSPQELWLRADLADNAGKHVIAMWHVPVQNAEKAEQTALLPFWHDLYEAHADIVLNGHNHFYERFAPMSPSLRSDPLGIRAFIVGTGGAPTQPLGEKLPTSEVRATKTFGVLALTLHRHSYDWQFVPPPGYPFADAGTAATHT